MAGPPHGELPLSLPHLLTSALACSHPPNGRNYPFLKQKLLPHLEGAALGCCERMSRDRGGQTWSRCLRLLAPYARCTPRSLSGEASGPVMLFTSTDEPCDNLDSRVANLCHCYAANATADRRVQHRE